MTRLKCREGIKSRFDAQAAISKVLADSEEWLIGGGESRQLLAVKLADVLFDSFAQPRLFAGPAPSTNARRALAEATKYWTVFEDEDAQWFRIEVEMNERFKSLDLELLLQQWGTYLEHEWREKEAKHSNSFPRIWKRSLLNFLKRAHDQHVEVKPEPKATTKELVDWKAERACAEVRKLAATMSIGRSETATEFEDRVKRMAERKGIRYTPPKETVGA